MGASRCLANLQPRGPGRNPVSADDFSKDAGVSSNFAAKRRIWPPRSAERSSMKRRRLVGRYQRSTRCGWRRAGKCGRAASGGLRPGLARGFRRGRPRRTRMLPGARAHGGAGLAKGWWSRAVHAHSAIPTIRRGSAVARKLAVVMHARWQHGTFLYGRCDGNKSGRRRTRENQEP